MFDNKGVDYWAVSKFLQWKETFRPSCVLTLGMHIKRFLAIFTKSLCWYWYQYMNPEVLRTASIFKEHRWTTAKTSADIGLMNLPQTSQTYLHIQLVLQQTYGL